jgi:hypothetical protein
LGFRIPEEKGRIPTARGVSLSQLFKELETARWEKSLIQFLHVPKTQCILLEKPLLTH